MAILVNISYLNTGSVTYWGSSTSNAVQVSQDNQVFTSFKYVVEN